jgi:hypothetical protein
VDWVIERLDCEDTPTGPRTAVDEQRPLPRSRVATERPARRAGLRAGRLFDRAQRCATTSTERFGSTARHGLPVSASTPTTAASAR